MAGAPGRRLAEHEEEGGAMEYLIWLVPIAMLFFLFRRQAGGG